MISGKLIILALFVPGLVCVAQDQQPASKPAEETVPAASAPVAPPVVPAVVPVTPAATMGIAGNSYVIGESDMITVTVLKEPTLSGNLLVRPDGMITMPLLGDIKASGMTPPQLSVDIAKRLKKYIQDPNVSVILTQINSKKVYLLGEVAKIGPVEITPGMTVLEAISSAGGLTQYANTRKMYILRNADGRHTKIPVEYKKALKGNSSLNLTLEPGDTIVVP
jgi:polysaccharide export outer membrane protein